MCRSVVCTVGPSTPHPPQLHPTPPHQHHPFFWPARHTTPTYNRTNLVIDFHGTRYNNLESGYKHFYQPFTFFLFFAFLYCQFYNTSFTILYSYFSRAEGVPVAWYSLLPIGIPTNFLKTFTQVYYSKYNKLSPKCST